MADMQHLTLEEHQQIAEFCRFFHDKGRPVFQLLEKRFPNSENPLKNFSQAVNLLSSIKWYCSEASETDRRTTSIDIMSEEWEKWRSCYEGITGWSIIDDGDRDE